MIQSYNGPMLQSHNEDANAEPFQVTVEAHSGADSLGLAASREAVTKDQRSATLGATLGAFSHFSVASTRFQVLSLIHCAGEICANGGRSAGHATLRSTHR